ncbi:MAG: hypothetical protein HY900_30880 [Deltaproteobacteria bacterium]|nr:hypothetical protein [Deltaproteobacteria bacterium]
MSHHEPSKELEALRADVAKIRSELSGITSVLKELQKGSNGGEQAVEGVRAATVARVRHAWDGVRERSRHSVDAVEHQVEERPLLSMLTVLGTGLVVGRLLGLVPWNFRSALESNESSRPES